ncbi:MAG: peptide chain release factor N(5)-glutamine methyltransferase [Actinomycetota bacterium]|nr:peptide chain release factor N(5)-glutamine methyltransferase [Actinomycetota bacterium]
MSKPSAALPADLRGGETPRLRDAVAMAAAELSRAGVDTPRLDAELLLGSVLGVGRERLVLDAADGLAAEPRQRFRSLITRRVAREPVAYILGEKGFRRITVRVDRRALIPRPETELLVEVGLSLPAGTRVIDVGTGSGAVALALKEERPDLEVWATEVSQDALALARENADRLGLDVHFRPGDLLGGAAWGLGLNNSTRGPNLGAPAILANLPYVPDRTPLAPEITGYEPASALFSGPDGLDLIGRLIDELAGLPEVSLVALEHGYDQGDAITGLLAQAGFASAARLRDLAGHERVAVGRR